LKASENPATQLPDVSLHFNIILHINIKSTRMFLEFVCIQSSTSTTILQHCATRNSKLLGELDSGHIPAQ